MIYDSSTFAQAKAYLNNWPKWVSCGETYKWR